MEVIKVTPRGYCKGVVRAISIAKQCAQQYPDLNITVLGMLVHNEYVKSFGTIKYPNNRKQS